MTRSATARRRLLRWAAPAAVAALAIGGPLAATTASAEPPLPEKSAQELLTDVASAEVDGLSGTVSQSADLGLPSLPDSQGGSGLTDLLAGEHTLRVWTSGEDKSKVSMHGEYGESAAIHNGNQAWLWNSDEKAATHLTYTGDKPEPPADAQLPSTPQEAAEQALDAVDDTTKVTVARNVEVAGRAAYELVLTPKDDRSLVSEVTIAVDGETSVPLRVEVDADGQDDPAFSIGFTDVDFSVPDDAVFDFTPPPGTKVEEETIDGSKGDHDDHRGDRPEMVGDGWTTVAVLDEIPTEGRQGEQADQLIRSLPRVSGDWGSGRLLTSSLFSVVITDDGRAAVGAVQPELLYAALDK